MAEDFNTADEPDLGQDDEQPSDPVHELHRIRRDLEEIVSSLRRAIEHKDHHQMSLDFTSFDAAVAELATVTASLDATISGDVSAAVAAQKATDDAASAAAVTAAVAAQEATDQAALEEKVAGLNAQIAAFTTAAQANSPTPTPTPTPAPTPTAPTITSTNPLSVTGGSAVTGQVTVSAGTLAAATSDDGAISMDASGNLSGTAGASGGSTNLTVVVTNADGSTTSLSQAISYS